MATEFNRRCSICNKVSSHDIQTNLGDFTKKSFVPDPKNPMFFICEECKVVHEDQMLDYQKKDDLVAGWLRFWLGDNDNESEDEDD
jgi:hypothetical protein